MSIDLQVIADRLPNGVLRHIASFCFRPLFKCDMCKALFGYTRKFRYYSHAFNLSESLRCQYVPVLYLSWDSAFNRHDLIGTRTYCTRCITACGFQTFIDPSFEATFFARQQIVVIQDFSSAFHDYHVLVCDWPKEDKPFTCVKQVMQTLKLVQNSTFKGFCLYTARLNGALVFSTTWRCPTEQSITLFEKGFLHFFANEHAKFSDVFINFRMLRYTQPTFCFWIEADVMEQLQIHNFPNTQQVFIEHFYTLSDYVETWVIERLRLVFPPNFVLEDGYFRLERNGDLLHVPTLQTVSTPSLYLVPYTDDLFSFIRTIYTFHPSTDNYPYHFNTDLFALTESSSDDDTNSDAETEPLLPPWFHHLPPTP